MHSNKRQFERNNGKTVELNACDSVSPQTNVCVYFVFIPYKNYRQAIKPHKCPLFYCFNPGYTGGETTTNKSSLNL